MSHHEGVSCDSCLKGNFRGKRFKCLICFDYDLCSTCYEAGATSTRHTTDHPMQCILTRTDYELFYGGEALSTEAPQAFTCPFCGRMGLTEASLQEHVSSEHADTSTEVICPICASLPGGEPNNVTDDFPTHLTLEHRSPRELDPHEEPQTALRGRRAPHPSRGMSSARTRRSQMQFSSSAGLSSLSPGSRESMDPIAELLSQLSGVRRATNLGQPHSSQLQQLQMQLQLERHASAPLTRQPFDRTPIERVIRRHQQTSQSQQQSQPNGSQAQATVNGTQQQLPYVVLMEPSPSPQTLAAAAAAVTQASSVTHSLPSNQVNVSGAGSRFLLPRFNESNNSESEQQSAEVLKADKSLFVQELLLITLADLFNYRKVWVRTTS